MHLPPLSRLPVACTLAWLSLTVIGCEEKAEAPPEETPPAAVTTLDALPEDTNAVQQEMRLLDDAMGEILTLIANDALHGIPERLERVHPARQLTATAIEQGVYAPPARSDDVEGFVDRDDAFHEDLKALLQAAKKDDLEAATDAYQGLVEGCTDCHTTYRFPGGRAKAGSGAGP
ncbi:MAG: cytochrome c [Myxococcota bacterium]